MALSLVGTDFRRTQEAKGFHRWNGRTVQDGSPCFESSRRHAADDQRWHYTPRTGSLLWHSRPKKMASALSRLRGAMALSESGNGSALSCRFDSCRPLGSDRSPTGTWQDRVSHVPAHIPCLARRDRSTRGRAAET